MSRRRKIDEKQNTSRRKASNECLRWYRRRWQTFILTAALMLERNSLICSGWRWQWRHIKRIVFFVNFICAHPRSLQSSFLYKGALFPFPCHLPLRKFHTYFCLILFSWHFSDTLCDSNQHYFAFYPATFTAFISS